MLESGTILEGKYEILDQIGKGGGGIVFLAYHHGLQKKIVVKQIKSEFVDSINVRLEVDILKRLHHENLPQVYDFVQVNHHIFTVMDYIEGYDLEFYRSQGYIIPEAQLKEWLYQLLNVLDYLHTQPMAIIHSDIKPANIMVNELGNVCLIDFNISIDTQEVVVKGASQSYAAPEQMQALHMRMMGDYSSTIDLNERTDLYSLGMTFYALVTGYVPCQERQTMLAIRDAQRGYSSAFISIIYKLMEENPNKRYSSAKKAMRALELIEKRPSSKLRNWDIGVTWGCIGLIAISACFIGIGIQSNSRENFMEDYEYLQDVYEAYNVESIRMIGTDILDTSSYKFILKNEEEEHADIYYMIGDSYYWEANYTSAKSYYEDALALVSEGEDTSKYYREVAICLAKEGNYSEAREMLEEASVNGILSGDIALAEAEILLAENDLEEAKLKLEALISSGYEQEILYRCYLQLADIYLEEGDLEQQIVCLEGAYQCDSNVLVLRKLGVAYSNYSSQLTNQQEKVYWNGKAQEIYEELISMPDHTYEDRLNCALVYENNGEYLSSLEVLQQMYLDYPDDYVVSKRLCYVLYYIEMQKSSSIRDFTSVQYYYEIAMNQYRVMEASGVEDTEMIHLQQLIDSLMG